MRKKRMWCGLLCASYNKELDRCVCPQQRALLCACAPSPPPPVAIVTTAFDISPLLFSPSSLLCSCTEAACDSRHGRCCWQRVNVVVVGFNFFCCHPPPPFFYILSFFSCKREFFSSYRRRRRRRRRPCCCCCVVALRGTAATIGAKIVYCSTGVHPFCLKRSSSSSSRRLLLPIVLASSSSSSSVPLL